MKSLSKTETNAVICVASYEAYSENDKIYIDN